MDDIVAVSLIRHGLTKKNIEKRYIGWTDEPLSQKGINDLLDKRLNIPNPDLVITSDLCRSEKTARLLFPGKNLVLSKQLREIHFGEWEGASYEELKDLPGYRQWLADFKTYAPPKGESYADFSFRVWKAWQEITSCFSHLKVSEIVVVTHSGPIRELLAHVAPEKRPFWEWQISHGNGYRLSADRTRMRRGERCTLLQEVPLTENAVGLKKLIN
ncbi:histidine phosphatase family protein [Scopulibacillus cellulosilyticus]|uniref:Histidine phosphatase family protein n=1 Tax=Scopulibacillus cellulosilyticus TaxID=2665665 RepID=A0ABW2PRB0_9BACL